METTAAVLDRCRKEAITRAKAAPVDVSATMQPGDYFRQGDIYLEQLARYNAKDTYPFGLKTINPVRRLAPGNTQGSRHCLSTLDGVVMYRRISESPLDGPIFESKEKITVEHPEHGHVTLPPGIYAVTYQRQYAEELKRVAD